MLTLEASKVLAAGADTTTSVTYTIFGMELTAPSTEAYKVLAQGQLGASPATIYTPTGVTAFVKLMEFCNTAASAVVVTLYVGGTAAANRVFGPVSLQPSENLEYGPEGFKVLDASGSIKQSGSGGTGRFVKTTVLTAGTTHKVGPTTTSVYLRGVGGGAGGGGASYAAANQAYGAGGGSGGYLEKAVAVVPDTTYNYTIGVLGSGGANTGAVGTGGGAGTFVVGATTYTTNGGSGGAGMVTGATLIYAPGGAGASTSTNGDLNGAGMPGENSERHSGLLGCSGNGGSTIFGRGGAGAIANGVGNAGVGYGAGGGGATAVSAAQVGGAGTAGCWIVDEYT